MSELTQQQLDRAYADFNFSLRMQSGFGISKEYAESLKDAQAARQEWQQDRITAIIDELIEKSDTEAVMHERWLAYQKRMNEEYQAKRQQDAIR